MQIDIFSIQKGVDEFENQNNRYKKLIKPFCSLNEHNIFSKQISIAQNTNKEKAQKSYFDEYEKYLDGGFNITLCEHGKMLDSMEFAKLIEGKSNIKFFIGGAYGFDDNFRQKSDFVLSFSKLTFAHKLVKTILLEQIYRGFCIINSHPYHK